MPRRNLIRSEISPYHVVARSNNREWFHLSRHEAWHIFGNYLWFVSHACNARIHAFVLMSNHFHLLISTPDRNLDQIMNYLMREVSRRMNQESGRQNHVFGGTYKWSLFKDQNDYLIALKYIYQNPVRAGICKKIEDYPHSTIRGVYGFDRLLIPITAPWKGFQAQVDHGIFTQWLNASYEQGHIKHIRAAIKKRQFEIRPDARSKRWPHFKERGF